MLNNNAPLIDINADTDLARLTKEVMQRYEVDQRDTTTVNAIATQTRSFTRNLGALGENNSIDTASLSGLNCLDLACGNGRESTEFQIAALIRSRLSGFERRMEPWLCRALHQMGVRVTGVDKSYPQYKDGVGKSESWNFVQMDLAKPEGLQKHFRDKAFDVITTSNFMLAEAVHSIATLPGLNSPEMFILLQRDPQRYYKIAKTLLFEMRRMLKIGGKGLINNVKFERSQIKELEKAVR